MKRSKDTAPKKRNPLRTAVIVLVCLVVFGGVLYQGYRVARDFLLEKVFVYFMENEEQQFSSEASNEEKMSIDDVAQAFERLNGMEDEEASKTAGEKSGDKNSRKKTGTKKNASEKTSNEQVAKDLISRIPEADKNRAIAIVSSVASVDDCFALYELAINGDQNAKQQLKTIYNRFTQGQKDELWGLYEKNKHLIE